KAQTDGGRDMRARRNRISSRLPGTDLVPARQRAPRDGRRLRNAALVTAAVVTAAVVGSIGSKPDTAWFRSLDQPSWQPDAKVFPIVWTALYGTIAWAGTRALNRSSGREWADVVRALGPNLALNAGWSWAFFRAQRPEIALAVVLAMDASNLTLLRRVWR